MLMGTLHSHIIRKSFTHSGVEVMGLGQFPFQKTGASRLPWREKVNHLILAVENIMAYFKTTTFTFVCEN